MRLASISTTSHRQAVVVIVVEQQNGELRVGLIKSKFGIEEHLYSEPRKPVYLAICEAIAARAPERAEAAMASHLRQLEGTFWRRRRGRGVNASTLQETIANARSGT